VSSFSEQSDRWVASQLEAIQETFIRFLTSDNDGVLDVDGTDPRIMNWLFVQANNLREHACSVLLNQTENRYVVPWAAECMDDLKARLVGDRRDFDHEAHKAAEAHTVADSRAFYDSNLKAMNIEALERATAASHQTYLKELERRKSVIEQELSFELASFTHNLHITTNECKANAQAAADRSVGSVSRSSAKANKGKARHDPLGKVSRSRSSSVCHTPVSTPPPSIMPLPGMPETEARSLMESAPIEMTPKASSFVPETTPTPIVAPPPLTLKACSLLCRPLTPSR